MKTHIAFIAVLLFSLAASTAHAQGSRPGLVQVHGARFEINGAPYRFIGTNFWYGMNLGTDDSTGDRKRLLRELDRLKELGVTNLRVMGASEGPDSEPWRIVPALQPKPGKLNAHVLAGLDYLLAEMKKRDMRAVVVLNNFWPWSGGMGQYYKWASKGSIPYPPPAVGGDWDVYQNYSAKFYGSKVAVGLANGHISKIVKRYANDPTIMAWELANEPRGDKNVEIFNDWIDSTAGLIKHYDPNHLVTTGSEGDTPSAQGAGNDVIRNHSSPHIDYATIHIWAQNWGWFDPKNAKDTLDPSITKMKDYMAGQVAKVRTLGKPLVIEEFGLARDEGSFEATASTAIRDRYYRELFEAAYAVAASGGPIAGLNFWAWGGEARPRKAGGPWRQGDPFVGDPPHEMQGWYSVYSTDASTLKVISEYATKMSRL